MRLHPNFVDVIFKTEAEGAIDCVKNGQRGFSDLWADVVSGQHGKSHSRLPKTMYEYLTAYRTNERENNPAKSPPRHARQSPADCSGTNRHDRVDDHVRGANEQSSSLCWFVHSRFGRLGVRGGTASPRGFRLPKPRSGETLCWRAER